MRSWYSLKVRNDAADLYIYDEIGFFGITASRLANELQRVSGRPLNVFINSPGGDVFDSVAIYNALVRHDGEINVTVDGLAASGASVIAQAGNTRTMATGASMMIHDAWGIAIGDKSTMDKMAEELDKISDSVADIYAERTDKSAEQWREQMRAETWYNADEAKEAGLADAVAPATQNAYAGRIFNLSKFSAVPEWVPQENEPTEPSDPVQTSPEGQEDTMDEQAIRQALGLDENADPVAAIEGLKGQVATLTDTLQNDAPGKSEAAQLKADLQEARQRYIALDNEKNAEMFSLKEQVTQMQAENRVEKAINSGRITPANRDYALKVSLGSQTDDEWDRFVRSLPKVDLKEHGAMLDVQMAELEPTEEQIRVGWQTGQTREDLIKQNARDKGIKLPA